MHVVYHKLLKNIGSLWRLLQAIAGCFCGMLANVSAGGSSGPPFFRRHKLTLVTKVGSFSTVAHVDQTDLP
jgi:hypothetical protein